jgi:hypothetical protein
MKCLVCENEINETLKVCPYCENDFVGNGLVLTEAAKRLIAQRKEAWENKQKVIHETPEIPEEKVELPMVNDKSYTLGWGTQNPGHIVYLIDLSESMGRNDGHNIKDVLDVVKECLEEFVAECTPRRGSLRPRFTASIIGYNSKIFTLFSGDVNAAEKLTDIEDDTLLFDISEKSEAFPRWQTNTAKGFDAAREDIEKWLTTQQKAGIPTPAPYVIHITDGHPELTDPTTNKPIAEDILINEALEAANRLKAIKTDDGNLLLFNIHYNTNPDTPDNTELITPTVRPLEDKRKQFLFDASSVLPNAIVNSIQQYLRREQSHILKDNVKEGSRAMISNAKKKDLLSKFVVFASKSAL